MENLRRKYSAEGDKEGLRLVIEKGREGRLEALEQAKDRKREAGERVRYSEIAEWLTLWMQSPEMFEMWIERRLESVDFQKKFPEAAR